MFHRTLTLWLLLVVPFWVSAKQEVTDPAVQRMAIDMENVTCEELMSLTDEQRELFLYAVMFLQRPGSLQHVIGTECSLFGDVEEVAIIADTNLTISDARESLFFLPQMQALLVTYKARNTFAYGMSYEGDQDPVDYFLERRPLAAQSASFATLFSQGTASWTPPAAADPEKAIAIEGESEEVQQENGSMALEVPEDSEPEEMNNETMNNEQEEELPEDYEPQIESEDDRIAADRSQVQDLPPPRQGQQQPVPVAPAPVEEVAEQDGTFGPEAPPPSMSDAGTSPLVILSIILFVVVGIVLLFVAIKMRARPEKAYKNSQ